MGKKILSKEEISEVIDKLEEVFPGAKAELDWESELELLIATILSAQCTDVRVNKITDVLFKQAKTAEDYLKLGQEEIAKTIRSCGFYNVKSKNIIGTCFKIINEFDGEVPKTREELMTLPGVGRKTANVVISNAFGTPAIAVDTHVFRVSNRIGLAHAKNVEETEKQLMENIDRDRWTKAHHLMIFQGRRVCKARTPLCEECSLQEYCLEFKKINKDK